MSELPTPDQLDEVLRRAPARARRVRRLVWAGLGVVAVLSVVAWAGLRGGGEVRAWKTDEARVEDLRVLVTAVGSVEPRLVVDVGSEQSGVVHDVYVDTNDRVTAGQPLAALDARVLGAQDREAYATVAALDSTLRQSAAALKAAEDDLARLGPLLAAGAVGEAEGERARSSADQARAARDAASAQLEAARARLDISKTNLKKSVIRAPIDGVILDRDVDVGQSVVASFQAVTLFQIAADLGEMLVEVDVDEADVPRVKAGQVATFTVPAWPDRAFAARVASLDLAPQREGGVVTYHAELTAQNPDGALLAGMTATARIEAERHPGATTIALAALRWAPAELPEDLLPLGPGEGRVWTLDGETPAPRVVKLGPSDGVRQAVEGLPVGTRLVIGQEGSR